jgi:hypothetical protein
MVAHWRECPYAHRAQYKRCYDTGERLPCRGQWLPQLSDDFLEGDEFRLEGIHSLL